MEGNEIVRNKEILTKIQNNPTHKPNLVQALEEGCTPPELMPYLRRGLQERLKAYNEIGHIASSTGSEKTGREIAMHCILMAHQTSSLLDILEREGVREFCQYYI